MSLRPANPSASQSGLGVRIRKALAGIAVLPLLAAALAFVGFGVIEKEQARISTEVIPALLETRKFLGLVRNLSEVSGKLIGARNSEEVERLFAQVAQEANDIQSTTKKINEFGLARSLVKGVNQSAALIADNLSKQAQAVRKRLELHSALENDIKRMNFSITAMADAYDAMSLQASDRLISNGEALHDLLNRGVTQTRSIELLDSILDDDATRIERLLEMRFRSRRLAQSNKQLTLLTSLEDLAETKGLIDLELRTLARLTVTFTDSPERQQAARSLSALTTLWSSAATPYFHRIGVVELDNSIKRLTSVNQQSLGSLEELAATVYQQAQTVSASSQATASATIRRTRIGLAVIVAVALLGSVIIAIRVIRKIADPIDRITKATLRLASGETEVPLPAGGDKEIANLSVALAGFRDNSKLVRKQASELQRSNDDLRQFAYVASHDLREPLRMVTSYLGLVKKRLGEELDETTQRHMAYVVEGASRMDALVAGLLSFARLNRDSLEMRDVDLNALLSEVCQDLDAQITETAAKIEWRDLPVVQGDPIQLAQLFQNLIGNAIKFCVHSPSVQVTAEANRNEWVLSVTDNGIGIDPAAEKKLFDLFARGQDREQFDGTGIGLSIVRKVVENHGGTIRIDPQFEGGSRMIFTLARDVLNDNGDTPTPH